MLHARSLLAVISATLALCPAVASAQESRIASLREAGRDGASTLQLGRAMRRAGRFDEAVRTLQGVRDAALRNDALWEIARVRFDQGVFQAARRRGVMSLGARSMAASQAPMASVSRCVCSSRSARAMCALASVFTS